MAAELAELTGAQKAAVFIMQMGRERAAKVLRAMQEDEIAEITAEIAQLRTVTPEAVEAVLGEFVEMADTFGQVTAGGLEVARGLLEDALGANKAGAVFDALAASVTATPFEFLRRADPRQVLTFIADEHPQTIALVVAHMRPDDAVRVVSSLPEDLQRDVAHRVGTMDRTSPDVVELVGTVLARRFSSVLPRVETAAPGGMKFLVEIINRADRGTERLILEGLDDQDPALAEQVRQQMFVFEDITGLDDKAIQLVLRQVDSKELAVALKGVRGDVRQRILKNLSERAAAALLEDIDALGAVRVARVEEAQGIVVRAIRALEDSGQVVLSRSADEFVE